MELDGKETEPLLKDRPKSVGLCMSHRLLVTLLSTAAMMVCYANQSSVGSTMVCMILDEVTNSTDLTNVTAFGSSAAITQSSGRNNTGTLPPYKYDWDKETQGWIHSSLFIGYYVTQIPSGILATRYGGKRVAIFGLMVSSLAQLVTPLAASAGIVWLCFVRAVCGFASGFIYAPIFGVLANWVPAAESSLLFGLAGTGMELGAVICFSLSAMVCEMDVGGGWPLVYYVIGGLGILIGLVFWCLVSDLPSRNRWMNHRERHYIEAVIGEAGGHGHKDKNDNSPLAPKIPVWAVLTSLPVWAIVVAQTGSDWLYYLLITVLPDFMKEVMHMSNTTIMLLTGLPFVGIAPTIYLAGWLADTLRARGILSTTAVRKGADFICKIFPGAILVYLGFLSPGQEALFIVLYVLACDLTAFIYVSFIINPVELSPVYTGFIAGICETGSMWIAIVVPIVVENITKDKLASQWQIVFYISGGLQLLTFLFYAICGSSVLQPWGRPPEVDNGLENKSNIEALSIANIVPKRARRLRRRHSSPYLPENGFGSLWMDTSISPFASDTEEAQGRRRGKRRKVQTLQNSGSPSRNDPLLTDQKTTVNSSTAPLYKNPMTSETENMYVVMTGSVDNLESQADEGVYETMTRPHPSNPSWRDPTVVSQDEPLYQNVIVVRPGGHDDYFFSVTDNTSSVMNPTVTRQVEPLYENVTMARPGHANYFFSVTDNSSSVMNPTAAGQDESLYENVTGLDNCYFTMTDASSSIVPKGTAVSASAQHPDIESLTYDTVGKR